MLKVVEKDIVIDDDDDDNELYDYNPPPPPSINNDYQENDEYQLDEQYDIKDVNDNADISYDNNKDYSNQYKIYTNTNNSTNKETELLEKINYMIHLLEEEKDVKLGNVTEEVVLYCFLGVFIIFVVDSFVKVGKYVR